MVAVILARGGSKGVVDKNMRLVGGRTLLARCINTCQQVTPEVWVSSDSQRILSEAVRYGAGTIERPLELATDEAMGWDALRHAVHVIGPDDRQPVLLAQCTAPFMTVADIRGTLASLRGHDMAVAVEECHDLLVNEYGDPLNFHPSQTNRQQRRPQYRIAGSCWAFTAEYICHREIYDGAIGMHLCGNRIGIDIDTPADLQMANALMETLDIG